MANRKDIRTAARLNLADTSGVHVTDDQINRAVDEVTADFSRVIPQEKIREITMDYTVTSEAWTVNHGTAVPLANKPIKWDSETVTVSGTDYTRDTDYTMDYANGTVTALAAGSITDGASATTSYTKDRVALDLTSLTDLLSVAKVEYSVGNVPQAWSQYHIWDNVLYIDTVDGQSQQQISDKEHIRVYYHAEHVAPTEAIAGSYPLFLDEVMIKGVVAYSLFTHHRAITHDALGSTHTGDSALGGVMVPVDRIHTALDALRATGGPHDSIAAALDMVTAALIKSDGILDAIGTHRTAQVTALDKVATHTGTDAETALDAVATHLTAGSDSADTALKALAAVITDLDGALDKIATHSGTEADAALDKVATHLTGSTNSAQAALNKIAYQLDGVSADVVQSDTALRIGAEVLDRVVAAVAMAEQALSGIEPGDTLAKAALAKVTTYLEGASDSAKAALNDILSKDVFSDADAALNLVSTYLTLVHNTGASSGDLENAEAIWATDDPGEIDHIESSAGGGEGTGVTSSAEGFSQIGDDLINAVNLGKEAARLNIEYAQLQLAMAGMHADRRKDFFSEADRHIAQARTYIEEANSRMAQADRLSAEAAEWSRVSQIFVAEAAQHYQGSAMRVGQATQHNQSAQQDIAEADQRVAVASGYLNNSSKRIDAAKALIDEASGRSNLADGFIREAIERNAISRAFFEEAQGRNLILQSHLSEAAGRVGVAETFINEARERNNQSQMFINEAQGRVAIEQGILAEAQRVIEVAQGYMNEAAAWANKAQLYANEAGTWIAEIEAISNVASRHVAISIQQTEISDRVLADARERHDDYWQMLSSRVHMARPVSSAAQRQYTSGSGKSTVPKGPTS